MDYAFLWRQCQPSLRFETTFLGWKSPGLEQCELDHIFPYTLPVQRGGLPRIPHNNFDWRIPVGTTVSGYFIARF